MKAPSGNRPGEKFAVPGVIRGVFTFVGHELARNTPSSFPGRSLDGSMGARRELTLGIMGRFEKENVQNGGKVHA